MKDDAELLDAFVTNRDEAGFRELVNRRIGFVYAVNLRRLRDSHLAEEATQAVFVALARKAAKVARCPSVIGWLHRSSCYESLNLMRARKNRLAREAEAGRLGTTTGGPLPSEPSAAWEGVLDEVLNELPEADREIIISRFFSNFSYAKIGGITGRSENASRMRADRALARLRDKLEARGFPSATAALAGLLPTCATAAVPGGLAATVANAALTALGTGTLAASLLFSMSTTKIVTTAAVFIAAMAFVGFEALQYQKSRHDPNELHRQSAAATAGSHGLEKRPSLPKPEPADALSPVHGIPSREKTAVQQGNSAVQPDVDLTRIAPLGWQQNGSNPKAFEVGVDPDHPFGGVSSAYVKSTDASAAENFGGMMQSISADRYKNQRVRMSGWIKTENANDGGGHLWLRVDGGQGGGKPLAFDNMNRRAPKGTTDWNEYSIVLDVPDDATSLHYGFFLAGKGRIWVNGVGIERVAPDIPPTNMKLEPPSPKSLPAAPVNLDFNPRPSSGH